MQTQTLEGRAQGWARGWRRRRGQLPPDGPPVCSRGLGSPLPPALGRPRRPAHPLSTVRARGSPGGGGDVTAAEPWAEVGRREAGAPCPWGRFLWDSRRLRGQYCPEAGGCAGARCGHSGACTVRAWAPKCGLPYSQVQQEHPQEAALLGLAGTPGGWRSGLGVEWGGLGWGWSSSGRRWSGKHGWASIHLVPGEPRRMGGPPGFGGAATGPRAGE